MSSYFYYIYNFYIHNYLREQHYKPSSVLDDYLSSLTVTNKLKRPTRKHGGQPYRSPFGLASSGVYIAILVTKNAVVSYSTFPSLPNEFGGISLLH